MSTTTIQVGGALGVAAFGTLYMSLTHAGTAQVSHAFAVVTAAFARVPQFVGTRVWSLG